MFSQTWKKYLPVITILIKRASKEDQVLKMNHTDFERAAGGRKIKYSFSNLILRKGRINSESKHTPLARDLVQVLQEDNATSRLIVEFQLEFSMNNDFLLTIKNTTPETVATQEPETETQDDESEEEVENELASESTVS
jgi:hypothetical protein